MSESFLRALSGVRALDYSAVRSDGNGRPLMCAQDVAACLAVNKAPLVKRDMLSAGAEFLMAKFARVNDEQGGRCLPRVSNWLASRLKSISAPERWVCDEYELELVAELAIVEALDDMVCKHCNGTKYIAQRVCHKCGGTGKHSYSQRKRASIIGYSPATFGRRLAKPTAAALSIMLQAEAEAIDWGARNYHEKKL